MEEIIVTRKPNEDASQVAAQAARNAGTKISGNLRWYGEPSHREANTEDGRGVRVVEPAMDYCFGCGQLIETDSLAVRPIVEEPGTPVRSTDLRTPDGTRIGLFCPMCNVLDEGAVGTLTLLRPRGGRPVPRHGM